ncbi:MAG: PAS domain S-box protein [Firmicutes bacterium]|nr:PAS domain S-box protein [Bacillota bacterium]
MLAFNSTKILIVEDSRLNAQITADILRKYGYAVEITCTGKEAVEKAWSSHCPDLILMDIELEEGMDGIQTAKLIQQFRDIPIVFLTANASREIVEKIRSVTGYGYVIKNTSEYVLLSAVEMALKLHEANTRLKQSERLFHNMFEMHQAVMLLIEPESGRIVDANKAACRFYGYPRETLLKMNIKELNVDSCSEPAQEQVEVFEKNHGRFVFTHRLAGGENRVVEVYSCPIQYQESMLLYYIIFDITERCQAEKELQLYQHIIENSLNEGYIFHPETFKFIAVNRGARENLGYTMEELSRMTPLDLKPELNLQSFRELLAPLVSGEQKKIVFNTVHRRKDGSLYPAEIHLQLVEHWEEKVYVALVIDLTERRTLEEELRARQAILSAIVDSARDAIIMIDGQGNITFWNPAAEKLFGYCREEVLGKDLHKLLVPNEVIYKLYLKGFKNFQLTGKGNSVGKTLELKAKLKNGQEIDVELSLSALKIKGVWHAVGIVRDISERKKTEELFYRLSITDPLTNAYNRRFFMGMIEQEMKRARRSGRRFSIIMLDLDHFKTINDNFGHAAGDMVLKKVTEMIKSRLRKTDILARWGGEEFIILLPETPVEKAACLAEELRINLSNLALPDIGRVTASFGVAGYIPADTVDTVITRTDSLLYEAKSAGRNCVRYEQELGTNDLFLGEP